MRKIIITIIIIVLALAVAYWLYWGWSGDEGLTVLLEEGVDEEIDLEVAEKRLSLVSEEAATGYWLTPGGQPYIVNKRGQIANVTTQAIENLHSITPSSDGRQAIFHFGYPHQSVFTIFNGQDRSWTPLPQETIAAAWHPDIIKRLLSPR